MPKKYVCIDIGGTAIKYALITDNGEISEEHIRPTEARQSGGPGIIKKIDEIILDFQARHTVNGVAISTAGMVDPLKGEIIYVLESVFPNYTGSKLKAHVETKFRLPCAVENDVNCVGLGELWLGAGQNVKETVFCITVGTGVGGCIIHEGKIIHGAAYSAGEIGFMNITGGNLQDLASAGTLVNYVNAEKNLAPATLNGKEIFALADRGDEIAVKGIKNLVENLAEGIANIVAVLNPHTIVLGGGIMAQKAYLAPLLREALSQRIVPEILAKTSVKFAELGNKAGMMGALYHLLRQQEN